MNRTPWIVTFYAPTLKREITKTVVGVDASEEAIELARSLIPAAAGRVILVSYM